MSAHLLVPSTLDLLASMLTAHPSVETARGWADEMLATGVSSDALIEMALLKDHEWDRIPSLLPQALRDSGIQTEPVGALHLLFFRLLLQAYLDKRMSTESFCARFMQGCDFEPGVKSIGEQERRILSDLFDVTIFHAPHEDSDYPSASADEVFKAAHAAAARLAAG